MVTIDFAEHISRCFICFRIKDVVEVINFLIPFPMRPFLLVGVKESLAGIKESIDIWQSDISGYFKNLGDRMQKGSGSASFQDKSV
jgi:hypothetical protein